MILEQIAEILNKNKETIEKCINLDNRKTDTNLKFDDLINVIKKLKLNVGVYANIDPKQKAKTFIIIYNGNPKITLEFILMSLFCKNNLIFIIHDNYLGTNSVLNSIIEKIIKKSNSNYFVKIYNNIAISEISKTQELADGVVYIGDKFNYQNFKKNTKLPIIYNGYGDVAVYTDDEEISKEEINKINEYAFENDIAVRFYKGKIEEDINSINYDVPNDVSVIFSNDNEKIEKFKNEVHSKKIFANENPFINYELNFDINDLL